MGLHTFIGQYQETDEKEQMKQINLICPISA